MIANFLYLCNIHVLIFWLMWTKSLPVLAYPLFCSRVKESRKLVPDPADLCPVPAPLSIFFTYYTFPSPTQKLWLFRTHSSICTTTHTQQHSNTQIHFEHFSFWNLRLYKIFVMPKHICKEIFRAIYILLKFCILKGSFFYPFLIFIKSKLY